MTLTERQLDKRTIRRDIERGRLNEADLIVAMDELPDVTDNIAPAREDNDADEQA